MNPDTLANAPANWLLAFVLITIVTAFARNWVYLRREILQRDKRIEEGDKRIAELKAEKNEYKGLAFKAVGLGERLVEREPT